MHLYAPNSKSTNANSVPPLPRQHSSFVNSILALLTNSASAGINRQTIIPKHISADMTIPYSTTSGDLTTKLNRKAPQTISQQVGTPNQVSHHNTLGTWPTTSCHPNPAIALNRPDTASWGQNGPGYKAEQVCWGYPHNFTLP